MNKAQFSDITERHLGRAIRMQADQNGDTRFPVFDKRVRKRMTAACTPGFPHTGRR